MLERDPVAFAAAGSVPIRESDCDNERAETQIARLPAVYKRSGIGGTAVRIISLRGGYGSAESKIGRLNRSGYCRH